MGTEEMPTTMDAQHQEIDSVEQELDQMQRHINGILELRRSKTPNGAGTYLRGLYDGLYYAEERVERITQYNARPHTEVGLVVPDDTLGENLQTVVSEAANGNWGNVRINLEAALEAAEELDGDGEQEGDS